MRTELPSLCSERRGIAINPFLFGLWSSPCLPRTKCAEPWICCCEFILPFEAIWGHHHTLKTIQLVLHPRLLHPENSSEWWPLKDLNREKLPAPFGGNLNRKAAEVEPEDVKVTISIGLMNFDHRSMMLKPLWGKRLPLKIRRDSTHKEILENGKYSTKQWFKMTKTTCCCTTMETKPCLCQVKHKVSLFCPSIGRNLGETAAELSLSCVRKRIKRKNYALTMCWAKIQILPVMNLERKKKAPRKNGKVMKNQGVRKLCLISEEPGVSHFFHMHGTNRSTTW